MEDKKFEPLGNYIEQIRGVSYKPSDVYDVKNEESIAILRANNIQNNHANFDDLVFIDKNKISQDQYLKKGDVLVCASSGSKNLVGKACLIKEDLDMAFGAFCKVIRTKKLEPRFLGHYFNSDVYRTTISNQAIGANINNIRKEHIDNLLIPIYTKDKQLEIVEKLDKISDMIKNQEEQIKKYDDLVKSQFSEMFDNKNYNIVNLQNVCTKITDGSHNPPKGIDYSEFPMLSSQNINQEILFNDVRYLTEDDFMKENKRTQVSQGDVLVTIVGTIGRSVVVKNEKITLQRSVAVIKPNENMNSYYINQFFKSDTAQKQFIRKAHGASQKGVYLADLKTIQIPTPPIELQNQFADFVKHIDKLKLNDMLMEVA